MDKSRASGFIPNIELKDVRPYDGSQQNGFEQLVCQLARRNPPDNAVSFHRVEGAGGDGGVEAYWVLADGSKIGYQAKFFTKTGDIGWSQIDESVKTALEQHPEIVKYYVAVACDLTDRSGKKARGKTGWEHWETHVKKWQEWATKKGMNVEFEPWTKDSIVDLLLSNDNSGLITYWFDTRYFDQGWFDSIFKATKADLGERFHPDDHVEVAPSVFFQGLVRSPDFCSNFCQMVQAVPKCGDISNELQGLEVLPALDLSTTVCADLEAIGRLDESIPEDITELLPLDAWSAQLNSSLESLSKLTAWLHDPGRLNENAHPSGGPKYQLRSAQSKVHKTISSVRSLLLYLQSIQIRADDKRVGYLVGPPGIGKSHLMADSVAHSLDRKFPAILFLGQHLYEGDLWQNILNKLDLLDLTVDQFLGALDACAEIKSTRCMILVDAINEGHHLKSISENLGSFFTKALDYKHLSLGISLRPEFEDKMLNNPSELVRVECNGITSPEEHEAAARQYIEKRGIVRVATPWLASEFSNFLFLRTCCEALKAAGKKEFPRGLQGSKKIFSFHIECLQEKLTSSYPAIYFPHNFIFNTVTSIAQYMAKNRTDCISRAQCKSIIEDSFDGTGPSHQKHWFDILTGEGALRIDHDFPDAPEDDPFATSEEVVRFSYQRFSDHLIVEALLKNSQNPDQLLAEGGPLAFMFKDGEFDWQWSNLIEALSVQIPEKFDGIELLDLIPDDLNYGAFSYSFWESLRWRSVKAFSKRTQELFWYFANRHFDPLDILIQLAVVNGHPWNSENRLDPKLRAMTMALRDSVWSIKVANITDTPSHPVFLLIDWALRADKKHAEDKTLWLTALTLTWLFSTTSRPIRDKATKALTSVLVERPHLFPSLCDKFADIDDLYILERLLATGYGAACLGIPDSALSDYASAIFTNIFSSGSPPRHPLLRDYAQGTIELAHEKDCLPEGIEFELCQPPFSSPWPLKKAVNRAKWAARKNGGYFTIYRKALGYSDFSTYTIKHNVRKFTPISLNEPAPLTPSQKLERFETVLGGWARKKEEQYHKLKKAIDNRKWAWRMVDDDDQFGFDFKSSEDYLEAIHQEEDLLVNMLSKDELQLYNELVIPSLFSDRLPYSTRSLPTFDIEFVKHWIAKRAYEYGWTEELFPDEPYDADGRSRPRVERVSKKYLWLALWEFIATLADNVWMIQNYPDFATKYSNVCDTMFVRDIEPTILPNEANDFRGDCWWFPDRITFIDEPDEDIAAWPFGQRDLINKSELLEAKNKSGKIWLVLKALYSESENHPNKSAHSFSRRSAFVRVSSIIVPSGKAGEVKKVLHKQPLTDLSDWEGMEITDGPYLFEFPWRSTWALAEERWQPRTLDSCPSVEVFRTFMEHHWESHLDTSLPDGSGICMPSLWLAKELGLRPSAQRIGGFVDSQGTMFFWDPSVGTSHSMAALVDRDAFRKLLKRKGLECLWVVAGEKDVFPDGTHDEWGQRTHGAVYRWLRNKWTGDVWFEDQSRGLEKYGVVIEKK